MGGILDLRNTVQLGSQTSSRSCCGCPLISRTMLSDCAGASPGTGGRPWTTSTIRGSTSPVTNSAPPPCVDLPHQNWRLLSTPRRRTGVPLHSARLMPPYPQSDGDCPQHSCDLPSLPGGRPKQRPVLWPSALVSHAYVDRLDAHETHLHAYGLGRPAPLRNALGCPAAMIDRASGWPSAR